MNIKSVISLTALALFILFATSGNYSPAESAVGSMAPNFTVSNADTTLSLQQLRGNYVLVTFWDSTQPESRIANISHDRFAAKAGFTHIAINTDRSQAVFGQLCRLDNLNTATQFHCGDNRQLLSEWKQLDGPLHSFLIDPQGTIIAIDPTPVTLADSI